MRCLSVAVAVLLCWLAAISWAQTGAPAATDAQLSPGAAYEQAVRPVEITHRSIENWSDVETGALAVAIKQAEVACGSRPAEMYTGDALIDLARLCALGQQWPSVLEAAERYLKDTDPAAQSTAAATKALAYVVDSSLQMDAGQHRNDPTRALAAAQQMIRTEPYSATVEAATDELLRYLELIQTEKAIDLAAERQTHLLAQMRAPATAVVGTETPLRPHELYASALMLPTLLGLENAGQAADAAVSEIDSSIPSDLAADEALQIANLRRQFALLGRPLPAIPATLSLFGAANETPRINPRYGSATVLLVFPEWCAQCVRMGKQFMPFLARHVDDDVHLYGLLAAAKPIGPAPAVTSSRRPHTGQPSSAPPAAAAAAGSASPKSAAEMLRGTPTLVVDSDLPSRVFAATDYPLLVATDHDGRIRFVQVAPENAFAAGSLVDQVVDRIGKLWPVATGPSTGDSR